ncbi:MAG: hypothetical protein ACEPO8_12505 [Rhodothermaceae bacterium]
MNFEIGTKAIYNFPESGKTTAGEIIFVGETTIHLKSFEGFIIKIRWSNFENLEVVDNSEIMVA